MIGNGNREKKIKGKKKKMRFLNKGKNSIYKIYILIRNYIIKKKFWKDIRIYII